MYEIVLPVGFLHQRETKNSLSPCGERKGKRKDSPLPWGKLNEVKCIAGKGEGEPIKLKETLQRLY